MNELIKILLEALVISIACMGIKINYSPGKLLAFIGNGLSKMYDQGGAAKYIAMPLGTCPYCMASFYGALFYIGRRLPYPFIDYSIFDIINFFSNALQKIHDISFHDVLFHICLIRVEYAGSLLFLPATLFISVYLNGIFYNILGKMDKGLW